MKSRFNRFSSFLLVITVAAFAACGDDSPTAPPTPPPPPVPEAPANLNARAVSDQQIDLSWTNSEVLASGFVVERSLGIDSTFSELSVLNSSAANTYRDRTVSPGLTYCYRVHPIEDETESGRSNIACSTPFNPDLTIPDIPEPKAPQPMTTDTTASGVPVATMPYTDPLTATVVGVVEIDATCDQQADPLWPFNCWLPWITEMSNSVRLLDELKAVDPNVSHECSTSDATDNQITVGGLPRFLELRFTCLTFTKVQLARNVRVRWDRHWQNLTSRVLGPGTDYSITYSWREGVETSQGYQYSQSNNSTTVNKSGWEACIGAEYKAEASVPAGPAKVGASTTLSAGVCFGDQTTKTVSSKLSTTLSRETRVSSERSGEETTSVSGAEDANRVYTVWQLVNAYTYLDDDGTAVERSEVSGEQAVTDVVGQMTNKMVGTGRLLPNPDDPILGLPLIPETVSLNFRLGTVIWPQGGQLRQETTNFAQTTTDFPIEGRSIRSPVTAVNYFDVRARDR